MAISIPKYAESPSLKLELENLLKTCSEELKISNESIPVLVAIICDVLFTVESKYESLIRIMDSDFLRQVEYLNKHIFELELKSTIISKISNN